MSRLLALILFALASLEVGSAATYYLATSGSGNCTTGQSQATPISSWSTAWGCLSAGDTLIVADGSYSSASPPAGKAGASGAPITIQAQNDGGAIITDGLSFRGASHIDVIGFGIADPDQALDVFSNGVSAVSHHLNFRRIGFSCSTTVSNYACVQLHDGTHHVLLEDSWAWGGGRYNVVCYGGSTGNSNSTCDYNTFRRLVLRQGPHTSSSGQPQAGLSLYYASNNIVENVIVLDSKANATDSDNSAFYQTDHGPPPYVTYNKYYGVIALNNWGHGWYISGQAAHSEVHNSVFWANTGDGLGLYESSSSTCANVLFDHVTAGYNAGNGVGNYCDNLTLTSSLLFTNTGYGARNGASAGTVLSADYNDYYGNTSGAREGFTTGTHDIANAPGPLYILRPEVGSALRGAGANGTDIGPTIVNRYQDGVLTTTPLWPWPNQGRIKKDMCTDAGVTTGFCGDGSLTHYVWNYLGNGSPTESASGTGTKVHGAVAISGTVVIH